MKLAYSTLALLTVSPFLTAQSVDLRARQTALKSQGNRNTCITFAAIAALEAAYRRAGYGSIDLSEEFQNYLGKMFWLHADWGDIAAGGADFTENQVAAFGGGGGMGHVGMLANGFRVPAESTMPYRSGYTLSHPDWRDPFWDSQRNANTFNLDRENLPRSALTASRYYSVRAYGRLADASNPVLIEQQLNAGREVVWDFRVRGNRSGRIWRADDGMPTVGAHSMLIVGYDRTDPNPNNHYFIVKNSWGPTAIPGAQGYTYIGYDYVRYGYDGGSIISVNPPTAWPELAAIGRYNLNFDGWRGTLDIYHLPGIAQWQLAQAGVTTFDRRLGTFYDHNGVAHRVNGVISGNEVAFWFKGSTRNLRWDDTRESATGTGRGFYYRFVDTESTELAGWHQDNPGDIPNPAYGGYARQPSTIDGTDGFLRPVFPSSRPADPEQYLGSWTVQFAGITGQVVFERRDDSRLPASLRATNAGLVASFRHRGVSQPFIARVPNSDPGQVILDLTLTDGRPVLMFGHMLGWNRGVVGGDGVVDGLRHGIYGVRRGDHLDGRFGSFGISCGGANGILQQTPFGTPEVGLNLRYHLAVGPRDSSAILSIGVNRHMTITGVPLPLNLGVVGAANCWLHVDPIVMIGASTDGLGRSDVWVRYDAPALRGVTLFTQFVAIDPTANAIGVSTSNAVSTTLGG